MSERIVSAAIKYNGLILSLERPARHHDIIHKFVSFVGSGEQGFLTSDGRFVDRKEARGISEEADQIIESEIVDGVPRRRIHPLLFSEDVW